MIGKSATRVASAQVLAPLGPLDAGVVTYFIAEPVATAEARPEDRDLAGWALEAWQRAAGGALKFVPAASESDALVRLYWVPAAGGQYGEITVAMQYGFQSRNTKLPGKYREVIVLRYLQEMDLDAIAEVLGASRSAIEVRLHRARAMLKDELGTLMDAER